MPKYIVEDNIFEKALTARYQTQYVHKTETKWKYSAENIA